MPYDIYLTTDQQVNIQVLSEPSAGQPGKVQGPVRFTVQKGNCTVQARDDLSAVISAGSMPGNCLVLVEAEVDFGAGVQHVIDTIMVRQSHPLAANLGIRIEAPVPK